MAKQSKSNGLVAKKTDAHVRTTNVQQRDGYARPGQQGSPKTLGMLPTPKKSDPRGGKETLIGRGSAFEKAGDRETARRLSPPPVPTATGKPSR